VLVLNQWLKMCGVLAVTSFLLACRGTLPAVRDTTWDEASSAVPAQSTPSRLPEEPAGSRTARTFELVYASNGSRDCDAEHIACFRRCWNTPPPYPLKQGDKGHDKHCTRKCREEYMECLKQTEARPLAFPDMKTARDWLGAHKTEVLMGSIVLVAGAVFVIATGSAGALVLVPIVAL
jgi:hypothetical protein